MLAGQQPFWLQQICIVIIIIYIVIIHHDNHTGCIISDMFATRTHTHTCTVIYAVRFNVYHNIVHICISCINLIIFDPDLCDPWHFFCQRIWSGLVKDWSTAIFQQDGALLRRCTSEDSHDSRVLTGAIRSHLRVFGSRPCHVRFFRCCSIRFNEFGSLAV